MRNDGFITGVVTGAVVGALVVMAMSPGVRHPMMENADKMNRRMRKMWRRGAEAAEEMIPDEAL